MRKSDISDEAMGFDVKKKTVNVYSGGYCEDMGIIAYILRFPYEHTAREYNQQFVYLANLIEQGTNILTFGKDEDGNSIIATQKQMAVYLEVTEKTVLNMMWDLSRLGIVARVKTRDIIYFIMNPEYAIHKKGTYKSVYALFGVVDRSFEDDINRVKKQMVRDIIRYDKSLRRKEKHLQGRT